MIVGLDVTWEITLVGLGSLLAGIGSFLAGYAALKRAKAEPPKPKPITAQTPATGTLEEVPDEET